MAITREEERALDDIQEILPRVGRLNREVIRLNNLADQHPNNTVIQTGARRALFAAWLSSEYLGQMNAPFNEIQEDVDEAINLVHDYGRDRDISQDLSHLLNRVRQQRSLISSAKENLEVYLAEIEAAIRAVDREMARVEGRPEPSFSTATPFLVPPESHQTVPAPTQPPQPMPAPFPFAPN